FGGRTRSTRVRNIRQGDRVESTELDDGAEDKETVTVIDVSGIDRKDITYQDSDDVHHSSTKMDTTAVRVHDRTKGALTGLELLRLNGRTTADAIVENADLADELDRGQHVFLEMDRYQSYNGSGFSGSIPAKVVDVQYAESSYDSDQVTLLTSDGNRMTLHAHHNDYEI